MRPLASILSACLLAAALPAGAQIYRWTDDRGGVAYGNRPPPGAARLTRLDAGDRQPGIVATEPTLLQHRPREFPGAATSAPSEFPGLVDRRTVASVLDSPELRRHQ